MMDEHYTTKSGHTIFDLGNSARSLFLHLMGHRNHQEWETLDERKRSRWMEVAEAVAEQYEKQIETTWERLASKIYEAYHGANQKLPETGAQRCIWEAVARHLINVVSAEDTDDLRTLGPSPEDYWTEWVCQKIDGSSRGDVGGGLKQKIDGAKTPKPPEDDGEEDGTEDDFRTVDGDDED